jgi:hypothetical protein
MERLRKGCEIPHPMEHVWPPAALVWATEECLSKLLDTLLISST